MRVYNNNLITKKTLSNQLKYYVFLNSLEIIYNFYF